MDGYWQHLRKPFSHFVPGFGHDSRTRICNFLDLDTVMSSPNFHSKLIRWAGKQNVRSLFGSKAAFSSILHKRLLLSVALALIKCSEPNTTKWEFEDFAQPPPPPVDGHDLVAVAISPANPARACMHCLPCATTAGFPLAVQLGCIDNGTAHLPKCGAKPLRQVHARGHRSPGVASLRSHCLRVIFIAQSLEQMPDLKPDDSQPTPVLPWIF